MGDVPEKPEAPTAEAKSQGYQPDMPKPPRRTSTWLVLFCIGVTIAATLGFHWWKWKKFEAEWERLGPIEASGGIYFEPKLEIRGIPHFRQSDDRWRKDKLGDTPATLAAEGCAVASAAMVLASYGADTDPGRLNAALTDNEGYVGTGWLVWEKAAEVTGNIAVKAYEGDPSYRLIDENLRRGNPVIVRLRTKENITHFVVVAGKDGYDYLTLDPGAGASKGMYPLKEFGSQIEKLRFYQRVPKTAPAPKG